MKKIIFILFFIIIISSCSFAYNLNDLNDYLNFYNDFPELFTINEGQNGIDALYRFREDFNNKFTSIFNYENNQNKIITCWYDYSGNQSNVFTIRIITPAVNTFMLTTVNGELRLTGRMSGRMYQYKKDTQTWVESTIDNTSMSIGAHWFIFPTKNNILYDCDSSVSNYISNNPNKLITQQQYMYASPVSTEPIYTDGRIYTPSFLIRIGQTFSINDYSVGIFTINDNNINYENINYKTSSTNENNIFTVDLLSEDLTSGETYYINLNAINIKWTESNGQKILVGLDPNGSSSGDNIIINGDLTTTNNLLNNLTNVVKSGDNAIISELQNLQSGENAKFEYWQNEYLNFFNYSGDYNYILRSGDFLGITIDYNDYDDWGFGDFVVNLFQNILYILSSSEDTTINFGFLGDISSADFKIQNSAINTFISVISNGLCLIMIIFFYYRLIKAIASLNLDKLSKYDFDSLFNLF